MTSLQKFALVHASFHNRFNSERYVVDRENIPAARLGRPGRMAKFRGFE